MTFDDDYIQLNLGKRGLLRQTCKKLGVSWPPPENIAITGGPFSTPCFKRVRGELMKQTVACPVLGEITKRRCMDAQSRAYAATNDLRIELRRACPRCPNYMRKTA